MQTLWPQAPKVPHHVRVFHVGLGVTLLRVDEGWKLHSVQKPRVTCLTCDLINYGTNSKIFTSHTHQEGIPDEENGGVVASQVPVALFSVKLDRKASWISHGVCWPRFTSWKETHLSHESAVSAAMILPLCTRLVLLTDGGEADSDGCRLPHMFKHLGFAIASDVMSHLKVAKRSCIMQETIS